MCQTLVQNCDARKTLIIAIAQDKRPLASRRATPLIAARQSAVAILEDMSKAIQVKLYSKDDLDLACLAAIGIRGIRLLCALNLAGHLAFEDEDNTSESSSSSNNSSKRSSDNNNSGTNSNSSSSSSK